MQSPAHTMVIAECGLLFVQATTRALNSLNALPREALAEELLR